MKDTQQASHGSRNTSLSGASDMQSTEASAWTFMTTEWRNVLRILLGLMIAFTWSSSTSAQIAIDGR